MKNKTGTAVILIGHGSRVPGSSRDMERVAGRLAEDGAYDAVEACHMSRLGPFFPETLEKCVKAGARRVIVIPYFLHSGLHLVLDMPEMIQREANRYEGLTVIYGKHLGYDESMVALVKQRIEESAKLDDVRAMPLEARENYPLPEGELEFVAMEPEEAKKFREKKGDDHDHNHHH